MNSNAIFVCGINHSAKDIIMPRHGTILRISTLCTSAVSVTAAFVHPKAMADATLSAGTGVAVQSNGAFSPLAEINLTLNQWKLAANISGYSESKTKVTHALSGFLYAAPLNSGKSLSAEIGLGALYAATSLNKTSDKMYNIAVPLGISWNIFDSKTAVLEANWRSWIFSIPSYIPPAALLSHDRFTTISLTAGVSI